MFNPPFTDNEELNAYLAALQRYVLALPTGTVTSENGNIVNPGGIVIGYAKRYVHVKYATQRNGTGFDNAQTNKFFYGLYNSDSSTESSRWYDYTWYAVDPANSTIGFSTDKFLFYKILGGRQIAFVVAIAAPDDTWSAAPLPAIDLESLIADGSVTNAKLANMAQYTIKGRISAGTGSPEDLTPAQSTSIINEFVGDDGLGGGLKGLVPEPQVGDADYFLKGDGTWGRAQGAVPFFIPDTETWNLAENYQGLFAETIDVEGALDIDGHLIGVD